MAEEKTKLTYEELEQRTLELTKDVLDHLGSKLQQDYITKPSVNAMAVKAADLRSDIKNGPKEQLPTFVNEVISAIIEAPFGNELKLSLAKIIVERYPEAPVKHYLVEDKREGHPSKNWG